MLFCIESGRSREFAEGGNLVTDNVDQDLWFSFTRRKKSIIFLNTAKRSMMTFRDILHDLCPRGILP